VATAQSARTCARALLSDTNFWPDNHEMSNSKCRWLYSNKRYCCAVKLHGALYKRSKQWSPHQSSQLAAVYYFNANLPHICTLQIL